VANAATAIAGLKSEVDKAIVDYQKKLDDFRKLVKGVNVDTKASLLDKLSLQIEKVRVEIGNARQQANLTSTNVKKTLLAFSGLDDELERIKAEYQ